MQGFAWEPHGNKFAVIHELQGSPGVCVSFYEMETDKVCISACSCTVSITINFDNLRRENEVEDTTAAVLMVDKYGGKDTPGNMAVNTRLPTHAL